jgi:hypothetical protein
MRIINENEDEDEYIPVSLLFIYWCGLLVLLFVTTRDFGM